MTSHDLSALAIFSDLRQTAEGILRNRIARAASRAEALSAADALRALHELSVHQIELEMQNDELMRALEDVTAGRTRHADFYDGSPAGFCSLDDQGLLVEVNLVLAGKLGAQPGDLLGQPIVRFILQEDRNAHCARFQRLVETGDPYQHEVRLVQLDGRPFRAHLAVDRARSGKAPTGFWAVVSPLDEPSRAL